MLFDRIPISQNKDIKIDDIETGTSNYDDKKGVLNGYSNWNQMLKKPINFPFQSNIQSTNA